MGADQLILLKPRCPAPDDPEILEFLRLACAICSTQWVELVVENGAFDAVQSYLLGTKDGVETAVELDVGDAFSASIRFSATAAPTPEAIESLSLSLKRTLDYMHLRAQAATLRGALEGTTGSILLFDESGDIVFANPPADRLLSLQTEDELLTECQGQPRQPLFTLLASLIEQVTSSSGGSSNYSGVLNLADGRIMKCEVTPIPQPRDEKATVTVVFLQPVGTESEARYDVFSSRYGLSPRENEVIRLLVQGLTTTAMADQLGISPHTIRDHIKHLYRKTQTRSRSELLGLISRSRRSTDGAKSPA
jgi:DNA-binding CsgD family transcriptional regulator